jgi:hypothetical protein
MRAGVDWFNPPLRGVDALLEYRGACDAVGVGGGAFFILMPSDSTLQRQSGSSLVEDKGYPDVNGAALDH